MPHRNFVLVDDLPVCVLGLSDAGVTTAANPIAVGVLSQRFESVIGRPLSSFFQEDHRVQVDRVLAQAKRAGRAFGAGLALASDSHAESTQAGTTDSGHVVDIHAAAGRSFLMEGPPTGPGADGGTPGTPGGGAGPAVALIVTLLDASARVRAEEEAAELRRRIGELERNRTRLADIHEGIVELDQPVMVGSSLALRGVREQVARVAPTNTTVLIHGETGSGKELVARSIHAASPRSRPRRAGVGPGAGGVGGVAGNAPPGAFIAVNCAALPESLIESELFGHERGAFTGADRRRLGKFELADGGTLFLDEVAELPMQAQAKLLRILQEGVFERVGGAESIRVDARIIAATHRDLARQVERGRFREDLFYRLNVFRILVPPLRQRKEDLRELAEHLHERVALRLGRPPLPLSEASLRRIMAYHWPGNIRELANAVERATLLADGNELDIQLPESPASDAFLSESGTSGGGGAGASGGSAANATRDILLDLTLEQLQRLHITHALEACSYRVFGPKGAARLLEVNPNTLLSRMDKYGIPRPRVVRSRKGD